MSRIERILIVPTLAQLPTETLLLTPTITLTNIPLTPTIAIATGQPPTEPLPAATLTTTLVSVTTVDPYMQTAYANATVLNQTASAQDTVNAVRQTGSTATQTGTPLPPTLSPAEIDPQPFFVWGATDLRECPQLTCALLQRIPARSTVMVTAITYGDAVEVDNAVWYRVEVDNRIGYIYSVSAAALPPNMAQPVIPPGSMGIAPPPPPVSMNPAICPSTSARCTQLTCEQAYACLAAGNRSLDRDGDGIPCESVCVP